MSPSSTSPAGLPDTLTAAADVVRRRIASVGKRTGWVLFGGALILVAALALTRQTTLERLLLVPLALAATALSERIRLAAGVVIVTFAMLLVLVLGQGPQIAADGTEYYQTLVCLASHGTPDLRAGDLERFQAYASAEGMAAPADTSNYYREGSGGRRHGYHFWTYEAVALLPMALLSFLGLGHLIALQFTNCVLFILAWWMVLRYAAYDPFRRRAFALLWFASPVLGYVRWPNPEVFTASLVVIAICLVGRREYRWAALCAALASTQNPPVVLLLGLILVLSALQAWQDRDAVPLVPVAAAASFALLPTVFNLLAMRTTNPIVGSFGFMGFFRAMSPQRTADLFLDLNMGLLPFVPLLLLLSLAVPLIAMRRRRWIPAAAVLTAVAMASTSSIVDNWNSATEGIMRYGTWILPLLIWAVVEGTEPARLLERRLLAAAVAVQAAFVAFAILPGATVPIGPLQSGYVRHGAVARFVLEHAPAMYSPEPDTFVERTIGSELAGGVDPNMPALPVVYTANGRAFKALARPSDLPALAARLGTTADSLREATRSAHRPGLVYVNISGGLPLKQ